MTGALNFLEQRHQHKDVICKEYNLIVNHNHFMVYICGSLSENLDDFYD